MKILRVYVDTSVIGGCLDEEFRQASEAFFLMAREGRIILLISDLLAVELEEAPQPVRDVFGSLSDLPLERVPFSEEAERLRALYLEANVVGPAASADALHIALATAGRADIVVSWNFHHIVHFMKIRGFNAVNLREGYPTLAIHSPMEVT